MPQEKLKQVVVRMSSRMHREATKMAKREKISFGELVRRAVLHRINNSTGYAIGEKGQITR
jgi:predicted HicB family RNase H-like nuclease